MTLSRDEVLEWLNERQGEAVSVLVGHGRGYDFKPALQGGGTLRHGTTVNDQEGLDLAEALGFDALEELSASYQVDRWLLTLREFPDLLGQLEDLETVAGLRIPMLEVELDQNVTVRVLLIREASRIGEQEGEENDG